MWSIWLIPNIVAFEDEIRDGSCLLDLIKVRILWWLKVKKDDADISINNLLYNFSEACVTSCVKK